jgi:hypothetical protein
MRLLSIVSAIIALSCSAEAQIWTKHVVMEQGHCNTAVALDANGDKDLDVIASFNGKVSLFIAPDWKTEIVLHRFFDGGGSQNVVWYENGLR